MITTLLRLVLHRSRADRLLLAAAFVTILLATVLLSAGPIYGDAVALAGLQRTVTDAPLAASGVEITIRDRGADYAADDERVAASLEPLRDQLPIEVLRAGESDAFELPTELTTGEDQIAVLGYRDGLAEHVRMAAGDLPAAGDRSGVAIPAGGAATPAPGPHRHLLPPAARNPCSHPRGDTVVEVAVRGVYDPLDPSDPYWWNESAPVDGIEEGVGFTTLGPFVMDRVGFLAVLADTRGTQRWRVLPDYAQLAVPAIGPLRGEVVALAGSLDQERSFRDDFAVDTELPALLEATDTSLLATRSGVLVTTAQLAILALYALLLAGGLLIETRGVETSLLRSRGASPRQIARIALLEGVALTIPAVVLGPLVAAISLRFLNRFGVLAGIGLELRPRPDGTAWLYAGIAGVVCLAALVVPAARAARRTFAQAQADRGRAEQDNIAQRSGLDLALIVVAALGLWQLRRYGAPITATVRGRLGIDVFLVAAPAIGLLAGAVLALRVIPALGHAAERVMRSNQRLVPALGAWQVSRRPLRYSRSALLLMLAVAIGLFATSYTGTWTRSQRDQADFAVGADVAVSPDRRPSRLLPPATLDAAYRSVPGVDDVLAVHRDALALSRAAGQVQVVAFDTARAGGIVRDRAADGGRGLVERVAPLAAARPSLPVVTLPTGVRSLTAQVAAAFTAPDPGGAGPVEVTVILHLLDGAGELHRVPLGAVTEGAAPAELRTELTRTLPGGAIAGMTAPIGIAGIELEVPAPVAAPDPVSRQGTVTVTGLVAGDAEGTEPVALDAAWVGDADALLAPAQAPGVGPIDVGEGRMTVAVRTGATSRLGGATASLRVRPGELDSAAVVPAVVTTGFLDDTGTALGDEVSVTVGGTPVPIRIVDAVSDVPSLEPGASAVVLDAPTVTARRFVTEHVDPEPAAWWLRVDDADAGEVVARLGSAPFDSVAVADRYITARTLLSDPVPLGIIGALSLGFVAALAFAAIGFLVSAAVGARERVTEFALLQALGLSRRQLGRWLLLENGFTIGLSLAGGIGLGVTLAWLVLPNVSLSRQAGAVVPTPIVVVPWATAALVSLAAGLLLLAVPFVVTRSLGRVRVAAVLRMGEER